MKDAAYRLHGDNIIECERTLGLIVEAFASDHPVVEGPLRSATCPSFRIRVRDGHRFILTFLPGFGRWDKDIVLIMSERGGILREATDMVVTRAGDSTEVPVLAIEYCGALPAGNQAWQRSGRALSLAHAQIPYLYVVEIGGQELDARRSRKSERMPNPAVPFSFLALTHELRTPVLPVLLPSPGVTPETSQRYATAFGRAELLSLLRHLLLQEPYTAPLEALEKKALGFVRQLAEGRRAGDSLTPGQWDAAYQSVVRGDSLLSFLAKTPPIAWRKTAYIKGLRKSVVALMSAAAENARGLTSARLPMCVVDAERRQAFSDAVIAIYPGLPDGFRQWFRKNRTLVICWVMGFKPRGDDARPDRGLPAFGRMLVGDRTELLTVVYGPAKTDTWTLLRENPAQLAEGNGLWEAILGLSDAVLADSQTMPESGCCAYTKGHWSRGPRARSRRPFPVVTPTPLRFGEHDVDTVLHLLFTRLNPESTFEAMCNPPGGDWSGLSLLTPDRGLELRWLSLPRVSASGSKRPDHVLQVFGIATKPVVLAVESKGRPTSIEKNIGPRLKQYVVDLLRSPPNVERPSVGGVWQPATSRQSSASFRFATAAAFILTDSSELCAVSERIAADLVCGFRFDSHGESCDVLCQVCSEIGRNVFAFLSRGRIAGLNVTLRVLQ